MNKKELNKQLEKLQDALNQLSWHIKKETKRKATTVTNKRK